MTEDEINEICAEFVGLKWAAMNSIDRYLFHIDSKKEYGEQELYTESVDVCLPLMEKLKEHLYKISLDGIRVELNILHDGYIVIIQQGTNVLTRVVNDKSLSLALSTAIAKVILKLNNKGN